MVADIKSETEMDYRGEGKDKKMKKHKTGLLPATIEGWCEKKRLFMRLLEQEPDPEQREVYEHAIGYCDRKVGQVAKMQRKMLLMVVLVNALVLLSILSQGCATMAGIQSDVHQLTRPAAVERGQ